MIAILDYRAGNLTSARLSFEAIGAEAAVTADPDAVRAADRIFFPGVGAAASAMGRLRETGLDSVIRERVAAGVPFLGVCLGMQALFDFSEEDGGTPMLGLLPGRVVRFRPASPREKIPHMGWNQVRQTRRHPLFEGVADNADFYFVHSYRPAPAREEDVIGATVFCGGEFACAVARGNLAATQFHPEKSGPAGLRLLANFASWAPAPEQPPCWHSA